MTEIRNIPVVFDGYRGTILGKATLKDGEITFTIKNDRFVGLAEKLITVDQIRLFMLGFQYLISKETERQLSEPTDEELLAGIAKGVKKEDPDIQNAADKAKEAVERQQGES